MYLSTNMNVMLPWAPTRLALTTMKRLDGWTGFSGRLILSDQVAAGLPTGFRSVCRLVVMVMGSRRRQVSLRRNRVVTFTYAALFPAISCVHNTPDIQSGVGYRKATGLYSD